MTAKRNTVPGSVEDGPDIKLTPAPCKGAGDDRAHLKRPAHHGQDGACDCGYCHSCHHARKRHRRRVSRLSSVRRLYGLSETDLSALLAAQRGRCACGRRMNVTKAANVDHWHGCPHCAGKGCRRCVRGLLCGPCNTYLGYIGDKPSSLLGLLWHVQAWPAQAVLTALDRGATMDTSAGHRELAESG